MRYLQDGTLAPTQQCTLCDRAKPLAEFHPDKSKKSGYRSRCRECQNAKSSEWGKNNLARKRVYRRQYYQANIERIRQRSKEWADKNRERQRANANAWAANNREKTNRKHHLRRLRLREAAIEAYGGRCACCGETQFRFLAIDHINGGGSRQRKAIPGHDMGAWLKKNSYPFGFQVLCHNCNQAKGLYGACPHQQEVA